MPSHSGSVEGSIVVTASSSSVDDRSTVSDITGGSHGTTTSALVGLVSQQAEMVRRLTEERARTEEALKRTQEKLRRSSQSTGSQSGSSSGSSSSGQRRRREERRLHQQQRERQQPVVATATALGPIPEGGSGAWVPFAPSFQTDPPSDRHKSLSITVSGDFPDDGPTPPVTPSPLSAAVEVQEVFEDEHGRDDGFGPLPPAVPGRRSPGAPPPPSDLNGFSTRAFPSPSERNFSAKNISPNVAAIAEPVVVGALRDRRDEEAYRRRVEERRRRAEEEEKRKGSRGPRPKMSFRRGKAPRGSAAAPPPPKKTIPLASTDMAPDIKMPEREESCASKFWAAFSFVCTFYVPSFLICKKGAAAKQAWREKVATCMIAVFVAAFFVGGFGFVPLFFCKETTYYTWQEIWAQNEGILSFHKDSWTVIHGIIYDVKPFIDRHTGGAAGVLQYLGRDASKLFPRTPAADLPRWCLNPEKNLTKFETAECGDFSDLDKLINLPCHDFATGPEGIKEFMGEYERGILAHSQHSLNEDSKLEYIIIHDRIYNVTGYVNGIKSLDNKMKMDANHENAYLTGHLNRIIVNKVNSDATEVFDLLYGPEIAESYLRCMDEMFYMGDLDNNTRPMCRTLNIIMYAFLVIVAFLLVLQCLCSLLYVARKARTLTKEMAKSQVMVMVPCYNEGDKELRKTIKSVLETEYPNDSKCMLVVADGVITGRGESMSTPETLAKLLGFKFDMESDAAHAYQSIGSNRRNRAIVHHGIHERDGHELKYIVVVKCGTTAERSTSNRPGNRGKRDSQLIIAGLFNRIHYGRELCELDAAICRALSALNINIEELKYLMAIDADTRVERNSTSQMVYSMEKDESILACCGETRVDNKAQSWVTMIQVYEYYSSHHMKKAFESVFGCVTCLPGCFTMYRIKSSDDRPLIACDFVFGRYARNDIESLHEKNLYHLGEDRMLTTLLLMHFPDMKLSFVPEAVCWTITPHTFSILLSQRRRWINSTFHNMWELLKVQTMCGICFLSMKTVVLADLLSTMILPASIVYAGYFIYLVFVVGEPMSTTVFVIYGIIIGCQVIVFLIRSRWDYIFWFLMYFILGIPVFFFFLPVYAFWHMDDLSWGQTRQVQQTKTGAQPAKGKAQKSSAPSDKKSTKDRRDVESADPQKRPSKGSGEQRQQSRSPGPRPSGARQQQPAGASKHRQSQGHRQSSHAAEV